MIFTKFYGGAIEIKADGGGAIFPVRRCLWRDTGQHQRVVQNHSYSADFPCIDDPALRLRDTVSFVALSRFAMALLICHSGDSYNLSDCYT